MSENRETGETTQNGHFHPMWFDMRVGTNKYLIIHYERHMYLLVTSGLYASD